MATLLSLPAEIRQTILLLCLPDEVNISKPWPRHIRSLAHICTLVRLDMRWVLDHWHPNHLIPSPNALRTWAQRPAPPPSTTLLLSPATWPPSAPTTTTRQTPRRPQLRALPPRPRRLRPRRPPRRVARRRPAPLPKRGRPPAPARRHARAALRPRQALAPALRARPPRGDVPARARRRGGGRRVRGRRRRGGRGVSSAHSRPFVRLVGAACAERLGGGGFELDARGVVFVGPGVVERVRVREEGRAVGLRGAVGRVVRVGAGATVGGEEAERLGAVVEEVKWGGDAERAFGEVVQVEGEGVAAGDLGCAVELNLGGGKGLGEARREFLGLAARDLGLRIESVGEGPRRWVRLIQDLGREKVAGEEEFDRET